MGTVFCCFDSKRNSYFQSSEDDYPAKHLDVDADYEKHGGLRVSIPEDQVYLIAKAPKHPQREKHTDDTRAVRFQVLMASRRKTSSLSRRRGTSNITRGQALQRMLVMAIRLADMSSLWTGMGWTGRSKNLPGFAAKERPSGL